MFFLKGKPPAKRFEPDLSKVRLYKGDYYLVAHTIAPSYNTYTLCEWDEGWDGDFCTIAMECAMRLLEDSPIVINQLFPTFHNIDVRSTPEMERFLKQRSLWEIGWPPCVMSVTHGPDRTLISSFDHDDDWFWMDFYAYRQFPGTTSSGEPIPPDMHLRFKHLHDALVITTAQDLDSFIDKLRQVCATCGRTLIVTEPTQSGNS